MINYIKQNLVIMLIKSSLVFVFFLSQMSCRHLQFLGASKNIKGKKKTKENLVRPAFALVTLFVQHSLTHTLKMTISGHKK